MNAMVDSGYDLHRLQVEKKNQPGPIEIKRDVDGNKSLIGAFICFPPVSLFYLSPGLCVSPCVWVFCDDFEKRVKEIAATTFCAPSLYFSRFKVLHI